MYVDVDAAGLARLVGKPAEELTKGREIDGRSGLGEAVCTVGCTAVEPARGVQTSALPPGDVGADMGGGLGIADEPTAADEPATEGPAATDGLVAAVEPGAGIAASAGRDSAAAEESAVEATEAAATTGVTAERSGLGTSSFLSAPSGVFIGRVTSVPTRVGDPAARAVPEPAPAPVPPAGFAFAAAASPALLPLAGTFAWSRLAGTIVSDFSAPALGAASLASSASCASDSTRLFTRPSFLPNLVTLDVIRE